MRGQVPNTPWHKVKAHSEVPKEVTTPEDYHIMINDGAHERAKEALSWHQVDEDQQQQWKDAAERALRFLREAGMKLADHPAPGELGIRYVRNKGGGRLRTNIECTHAWGSTRKR